jgi:hypothetical protein
MTKKEETQKKEIKKIIDLIKGKKTTEKPADKKIKERNENTESEREKEIEEMIKLVKKDNELLKKDRLTEKVNKLVEETERELGRIQFYSKPEKIEEKKKKSFLEEIKKIVKK